MLKPPQETESRKGRCHSFDYRGTEESQQNYDFEDFDLYKPAGGTPQTSDGRAMPSKCDMLKHFSKLAGPSVVTNVFSYMVMTVNTIFAGQFQENSAAKLAGVGLGSMVLGMFCRHVLAGVNCAQETLVS